MRNVSCGGFGFVLAMALLAGCSSQPPREIGPPIADAPTTAQARKAPQEYLGRSVRWGGEILSVHNADGHTDIELFGRPLYDDAEPRPDGGDGVRFIARVSRFVDPVEYAPGKRLSVRGKLREPVTRPVGDYAYRYPVVAVEGLHLWPAYQAPAAASTVYDPYYYDPWWPYGPFGPFSRWPHHRW